jgi:methylmalonyl-CoA mutase N-terminal domain/subunit
VGNVADPLGGSWYVEALTDKIEAEAEQIFDRIKDMAGLAVPSGEHLIGEMTSGILRGIEDGWFTGEIADAAFAHQQALEKAEKKMVGVNCHTDSVSPELEILRVGQEVETEQRSELGRRRAQRDQAAVDRALAAMVEVARGGGNLGGGNLGGGNLGGGNLIEPMLSAARAEATLGEICDALRTEWGSYTEPARF